jgi:hypothetical protein
LVVPRKLVPFTILEFPVICQEGEFAPVALIKVPLMSERTNLLPTPDRVEDLMFPMTCNFSSGVAVPTPTFWALEMPLKRVNRIPKIRNGRLGENFDFMVEEFVFQSY